VLATEFQYNGMLDSTKIQEITKIYTVICTKITMSQCTHLSNRQTDGEPDEQKRVGNAVWRCITCSRTAKTDKKPISRWESERELFTTSYAYYEI